MPQMKSKHEEHLLQVSKDFDGVLSNRSTKELDSILSSDVTLHKDGITLGSDIKGVSGVKDYMQAYIDKYDFEHDVIAGAVDEQANVTFSFWQDKGVRPHGDKFEDLPSHAKQPTETVGIWHLQLDGEGQKVKDIFFLRQLSPDETHRKLMEVPDQSTPFDPSDFKGSDVEQAPEQAEKNDKLASTYNDMWKNGDPSSAGDVLAEDFEQYQPVLGSTLKGKDNFVKLIHGFAENWKTKEHTSHIAVSAGDKAFIWWQSTGTESKSGKEDSLYGLNLLVINPSGKIQKCVGFRQLTSGELEKHVKPEVQR